MFVSHTQTVPSLRSSVSVRTSGRHHVERLSRCSLRVLPLISIHHRLNHPLELRRTRRDWTAIEWNHVDFSEESRFDLSNDDNCVRV
ncbi:hypothetical protein TNCV_674391 [Trichonephila clavipes]|nr:hypothetical protein TNCV_674391 [Trichonephila clavipes]